MKTIFIKKMVLEKEILAFYENIIGEPIDSLLNRKPDSPFFFQYENYDGEFKVMVSLSVNPRVQIALDADEISKQMSLEYSSEVIFELDEPIGDKNYKIYYEDGSHDYINVTDSESGISVQNGIN